MEDFQTTVNEGNVLSTVQRLASQVEQLQQTLSSRSESSRKRGSEGNLEGSGEEASDNRKDLKVQHGIRADTFKIFKFDGTDYHLWEFSMRRYLKILHLWEYVSGEVPKPSSNASPEEISAWEGANTEAEGIIMTSVTKNQLQSLTMCSSAEEMWLKLKDTFQAESNTNKLRLLEEYHSYSMKKGTSIESHIKSMDALVDRLRGVGELVSDHVKVLNLLKSLPREYNVIRTTLLNKDELTYSQCCSRLLDYSAFFQKDQGGSSAAYYGAKKERTEKLKISKCFTCGEKGHISPSCPLNPNKETKKIICFNCEEAGHISTKCPKKKAGSESKHTFLAQALVSLEEVQGTMETNLASGVSSDGWIIDSGATHHMCHDKSAFVSTTNLKSDKKILLGDSSHIDAQMKGEVKLTMILDDKKVMGSLKNVLYTPKMSRNLFSVTHCVKQGNDVYFDSKKLQCHILSEGRTVARAHLKNNLWILDSLMPMIPDQDEETDEEANLSVVDNGMYLWHLRFGHLGLDNLKRLKTKNMVRGLNFNEFDTMKQECFGCAAGKQQRNPFSRIEKKDTTKILELIHSDLMGPLKPQTLQGKSYVLTFIDDCSRRSWIYLLKSKDETLEKFKIWKNMVENGTDRRMKVLRTDNGGEFVSKSFKDYLQEQGIEHQTTVPRSPQQNGLAERFNRTIIEMTRSMIHGAGLPKYLWGEAIQTANYLKNRSPHRGLKDDITPIEVFSGRKPGVHHLRVFGSRVFVHIPQEHRSKLSSKSFRGVFVGYAPEQRGYRIWKGGRTEVIVSRDVIFMEDEIASKNQSHTVVKDPKDFLQVDVPTSNSSPDDYEATIVSIPVESQSKDIITKEKDMEQLYDLTEEVDIEPRPPNILQPPVEEINEEVVKEIQVRRSGREKGAPTRLNYQTLGQPQVNLAYCFMTSLEDPLTLQDVLSRPDKEEWLKAIDSEMQSLYENNTWTLVDLPKDRKAIGSKWIFKLKKDANGSKRYKARLVAKGYAQQEGIDYTETFAPVIKYQSLRMLLAIATEKNMLVHQMDVKTAFLNGILREEIYLVQPEGNIVHGQEEKVCKLNRSLYGLKQSPRCWNQRIDNFLRNEGFNKCLSDNATYVKGKHQQQVYLGIYVDDIIIISAREEELKTVKATLCENFKMVDFGEVNMVLGIQVRRNLTQGITFINQEEYAEMILKRFNMQDSKGVDTLMPVGVKYSKTGSYFVTEPKSVGDSINQVTNALEIKVEKVEAPYRQAIGSLMYLMTCTRPDLAASIEVHSRYMADPAKQHWEGVKRVFRYLNKTKDYGIRFQRLGKLQIIGFCDSDWGGCLDTRRSTSGYVFLMNGACISWSSKRQGSVALSTCESEFMAGCHAAKEAVWLRNFITRALHAIRAENPSHPNAHLLHARLYQQVSTAIARGAAQCLLNKFPLLDNAPREPSSNHPTRLESNRELLANIRRL